jgi:hypothetical protein
MIAIANTMRTLNECITTVNCCVVDIVIIKMAIHGIAIIVDVKVHSRRFQSTSFFTSIKSHFPPYILVVGCLFDHCTKQAT